MSDPRSPHHKKRNTLRGAYTNARTSGVKGRPSATIQHQWLALRFIQRRPVGYSPCKPSGFFRHNIVPCQLVDTNEGCTRTTMFGHEVSAPFGIAPIGINKIYHPQDKLPVAKVAGGLGISYSLSTAVSCPIEDIAEANDAGRKIAQSSEESHLIPQGPRFFQLYMPHDDELTFSLLKRAH
ncbi:hypothetical protein LB504_007386 [Fusarium proliferatum]|nr:hypothetical protein LB504_007386 [Fusarium proliferatum]